MMGDPPRQRCANICALRQVQKIKSTKRSGAMGAFFSSLGRTITAGVVLLIIIVLAVGGLMEGGVRGGDLFIVRWLHVMAGVMWIGLLWYFNFVQTPSMPKIPDEQKPAVSKVIAPSALFWFRWSALATVILGLLPANMN